MMIDSHCHLDYHPLIDDLKNVLEDASNCGVQIIQTISTKIRDMENLYSISQKYDNVFCSVGDHPCNVEQGNICSEQDLYTWTSKKKVIGIGETGLDYHYSKVTRKAQIESFIKHIEVAQTTKLPIIIHCRNADDDMISLLESSMKKKEFSGVMHCFNSSLKLAKKCLEMELYISASGIITFKNSTTIRNTFSKIPHDRLLIETDSPFLAPDPHRGQKNRPGFLPYTASSLAKIVGLDFQSLCEITTKNFLALFKKVSVK